MNQHNIVINSPLSVRKGTRGYYKYKFKQACAQLVNNETSINIEKVPGLLKVRKVKSKDLPEKKTIRVTQVCGLMTGKWLLDIVKEIQLKAWEKQKKQQEVMDNKVKDREAFSRCKEKCICTTEECYAKNLK